MGLDEVLDEINKKTEIEVKRILDNAYTEAAKIRIEADKEYENIIDRAKEKAARNAERLKNKWLLRLEESRKLEERKILNQAINTSIENLKRSINNIKSDKVYRKWIEKKIAEAIKLIGQDCSIYVSKNDFDDLSGIKNLKISKNITGGFYAVSSNGKKTVDMTLDRIVDLYRDKILQKVTEKLEKSNGNSTL